MLTCNGGGHITNLPPCNAFSKGPLNALVRARGTQEKQERGGAGTLTYNQCWTHHCLLAKLQFQMFYSAHNAGDGKREVSTVHGRHFFQPVGHKRCYCLKRRKRRKTRTSHCWQFFWVSLRTGPQEGESLSYHISGGRFNQQNLSTSHQLGSFALQVMLAELHSTASESGVCIHFASALMPFPVAHSLHLPLNSHAHMQNCQSLSLGLGIQSAWVLAMVFPLAIPPFILCKDLPQLV